MSNNRMWLVNERLGTRALVAKYYPSTGWFMPAFAPERINESLDADDEGSSFGSTDWKIEFEVVEG